MDDAQTLRSMVRDDAYCVEAVLADGPSGKTELVTLDGEGPLVRKHIPVALANASAWAAAMEIDEPLLPRIESLYRMPDELVVVYEFVPGTPLDELMRQKGHLAAHQAVNIVSDVCRAVSALHEHKVVHRDITPGNVIVAKDGSHLVDLGIARQKAEGRRRDTTTLGTWGFAAPEQFGFAQTDARSDVYSLGCLLGHLMTGVQPGTDAYEEALDDRSLVPPALAEVIRKASAFEPSARYQSAQEFSDELRGASSAIRHAMGISADMRNYQTKRVGRGPAEPGVSRTTDRYQVDSIEADVGDGPRTISAAPTYLVVLVGVLWGAMLLFAILVAITFYGSVMHQEPAWGPPQYAMSVVIWVGLAVLAREFYQFVTLRGPYARKMKLGRLLLSRTCIILLIIFALFVTAAAVFSI